jgi:hypothetical protein
MKGLSLYPNVPLTVLQRKGTEGAEVHVANPKSHNYKLKQNQSERVVWAPRDTVSTEMN